MAITFISHSSAETEEDQANVDSVRGELRKRLPDFGWEVRVDDQLPSGVDWRWVLHQWLDECDAAVVLVNRDWVKSPWFKREVEILLHRRAAGARLTIVPVVLRGYTTGELRRSGMSRLADLQCIVQEDTGGDAVAARVVERLGELGACASSAAMRSMTVKIEHCLGEVNDRFPLRNMARALGSTTEWMFPTASEGRRLIAHRCLAQVPTQRVPGAVKEVEFFLALDRLNNLISMLLPTWIDPAGVRPLVSGGRHGVATLAGAWTDTARQHIHRASYFSGDYCVQAVSLVAGEAQEEEHMEACLTAVRALLKTEDENELPLEGQVLFLVIDPAGTELGVVGNLVRTLIDRFSWLNVIVLTNQDDPAGLGAQLGHTLHIPLHPDAERRVARTRLALDEIRANRNGRGKDQVW